MDARPSARPRVILLALAGGVALAVVGGLAVWAVTSGPLGGRPAANGPGAGAGGPGGEPQRGPWVQDFAAALAAAARDRKDLLVSFEGSDWCLWCQRMDREIFTDPTFLDQAPRHF